MSPNDSLPTAEQMVPWCAKLIGADPRFQPLSLQQYLAGIPRLESLSDVPAATPVLVRGDLDAKPGEKVGKGDERLRSMLQTLEFGRKRGWKQILFGHIGRRPEGSLAAVGKRLEELLGAPVPLLEDWYDESVMAIADGVDETIARMPSGGFLLLENTRKYDIECALWEAGPGDLAKLSEPLARFASQFAEKVARVYVHEALSAGSLDSSSTVVPAAMDRVALGAYAAGEFDGPMLRCLATRMVVFSGLKIDKLDDLEAMIGRGTIRLVFAAGSLAMALKKAAAELEGGDFGLGLAEDPANSGKDFFISPERIEQARRMLSSGREKGIEFVLPVDFVLADGTVSESIGPGRQQFDVGPRTRELFARKVDDFIAAHGGVKERPAVVFHNGVFGWFEKPAYEAGTKSFMEQLRRLTAAGCEVYVGGGEGGKALSLYGKPEWVTHTFTAGGTVLNALGNKPVPYLLALHMAANRSATK